MDYEQAESSQRQHNENLQHQEKMNIIIEKAEYNLFSLLNPILKKDGDKWCCLLGEKNQEGMCGFGETPYDSILDFNKSFYKK